jgi:hypothetical protein
MTTPTETILGLGQGLAVIDHESAWQRLETLNDMLSTDSMQLKEMALALELKAYMINRVRENHHSDIVQKRKGLTRIKADVKSHELMTRHNRRLLALREIKDSIDQSNYH